MSSTATHTTVSVVCPMHAEPDSRLSCGGEAVVADYGTFDSTQILVAPCSSLVAQGWPADSPQLALRKSDEARLCGVEVPPVVVRHVDGLVTFRA